MDRAARELTALRLSAQGIASAHDADPASVVRRMLAMQAQDLPGALWSVGLRTADRTRSDVQAALDAGTIARSWPFRGTLHLVAPEDLGWMLPLAAQRQATTSAKRRADLGIDDATLELAEAVARELLEPGPMRRDALLAAWEQRGIVTAGQRGYHLLWNLAQSSVIVFGPADGKQPTFALFEQRVPAPRRLERDELLAELARRYFTAHGPATVRDLAWWASITLTDARAGLAASGDALELRTIGGVEYAMAPGLEPDPWAVHVLPGFDEYLLGYQDRSAALPAEHAGRIVPGGNGIFLPTVVAGGEVVGLWRRAERRGRVDVTADPFGAFTGRARDGLARALRRYGRFIGAPVQLLD
jgi:hypothetical protein